MSKRLSLTAAGLLLTAVAQAHVRHPDVTVEVVDEHGSTFTQVPVRQASKAYRAYLQAERGARYRIRVTNRSNDRVGLVVAVDGRNIISGTRSELEKNEPMYILAPWETEEYSGWRTSLADVHEFYFTEWEDSYAEAFGDRSARGVIAVAVYKEKESQAIREQKLRDLERQRELAKRSSSGNGASRDEAPAMSPPPATAAEQSSRDERRQKAEADRSEPGTGYGDRRDEPAVRVAFDAEPRASSRVFLKYEWRETLCSKRIVTCEPENRFWPSDDNLSFAPPPPRASAQRSRLE